MISSQVKNAEKNSEGLNTRVPEGKSKTPPQSLPFLVSLSLTHTLCVYEQVHSLSASAVSDQHGAGLFATIKIKNLELLTPLINLIFPISSS